MLLRIEDTDSTRCRPAFTQGILEDLAWLGIDWDGPVRRQSDHTVAYEEVLAALAARGLLYPCSCSRREIAENGAVAGLDGLVYPGTCRGRPTTSSRPGDALRLDLRAALAAVGSLPAFEEEGPLHRARHEPDPAVLIHRIGDPVLRRRQTGDIAYHLACPHDDAVQGVTHVIRGIDLWHVTPIHVLMQTLMDWPVPRYHHHDLVRDDTGRRLAKIDHAKAISRYRAEGYSVNDVLALLPPVAETRSGA